MIQSCWALEGPKASEMSGRAKLSTVLSTETSSTGSMSTASAAQPRQPTRFPRASAKVISSVNVTFRAPSSLRAVRFYTVQPV